MSEKRANQAERILNEPLVKEAFEIIEQSIMDKWVKSKAKDTELREALYLQLHAFNEFKRFFTTILRDHAYQEKLHANGTTEHRTKT